MQRDLLAIVKACQKRSARISIFAMSWQGDRPEGVDVRLYPGRGFSRTARRRQFTGYVRHQIETESFEAVVGFNKMPGLDYYYAADSCFAEKAYNQRGFLYRMTPRCRQYLDFEKAVFGSDSKTHVLLISPLQKQQFQTHYPITQDRLTELPPGIEENRKAGSDAAELRAGLRREFDIEDDQLLVLQIGSGFAVKGVDRSLRAIAGLPENVRSRVRYLLVGHDKPGPYLKLAGKLGISEHIRILPGRDDIPRFLQGADILLHPAYSESAGMVLVEAIVAGLPVLTTDTCGYAFHVSRAGAGHYCASPFLQENLNRILVEMLLSDEKQLWRDNGIRYGRQHDLYHMPEKVAEIVCNSRNY